MTPRGDSISEVQRLLKAGFSATAMEVSGVGSAINGAILTLEKGTKIRKVEGTGQEFALYCLSFHRALDADGRPILKRFKDNDRYWREQKKLAADHQQKVKTAVAAVARRGVKGSPRGLITGFLMAEDRADDRFLPLKDRYFEIYPALILELKSTVDLQAKLYKERPLVAEYGSHLRRLLDWALPFDDRSLERLIAYLRAVPMDVVDLMTKAATQQGVADDLQRMVAAKWPLPGDQGLPFLLDVYRRECEALRPFIYAISEAMAMKTGKRLAPNLGYTKRVEYIKENGFGEVVDCLDPAIRHSESHGGTEIDHSEAMIRLTEETSNGARKVIREYSYWQFVDLGNRLQHGLFLGIMIECSLQVYVMLAHVMRTTEFVDLLLAIDNLAD